MKKSNFRFANNKDFEEFFGESPIHSAKAWVYEVEGKIAAIGGVWFERTSYTSFVRIKKKLINKKEFWKISKFVTNELRKLNVNIFCERDKKIKNSHKYLTKLGYKFFGNHLNKEIYILCQEH